MIIFLVVLTALGKEEIIIINCTCTYLKVPKSNTTYRIPRTTAPRKEAGN